MEHVFPFLWHHGESKEQILEEIEKIQECGLRAFCVESRPHPDFCGDGWWSDLGFILFEARKRGMQVWVLDEEHYPSGRAMGKLKDYPHLQQENIVACNMNTVGEIKDAKILLPIYGNEHRFIAALAFPLDENDKIVFDGGIDVTDKVYENVLYWDVPKGHWRIIGLYTIKAPSFVDPLNIDSTKLLINLIYEPHYQHFKDFFGTTFVGFFADEPRLGNIEQAPGVVNVHNKARNLGVVGMAYNWHDKILTELNITDRRVLAALWFDIDSEACTEFRVKYMDFITEEYAKNYSDLLGDWCREHGVSFTGHVIEDVGAHARTMVSGGHYFKSLRGQDLSGIDIVYNQVKRNQENYSRTGHGSPFVLDPLFYNFTLAKLAVSSARLEPVKRGRALCELFGAYGWGESIAEMKWLIDFMLVRGINHFVPHAFNPKLDDTDSPPYFYNGGRNPQYTSFVTLMKYLSKMCAHLNGGKVESRVAVLYHSNAEWSGRAFEPVEKVLKFLAERQIECDVIPEYEITSINGFGVHTKHNSYDCLLIPPREYLDENLEKLFSQNPGTCIRLTDVEQLKSVDIYKYSAYMLKEFCPSIRVYRYEKEDVINYFVFNEGLEEVDNVLYVKDKGYYKAVDEQNGLTFSGISISGLPINLRAGQSVLFSIIKKELKSKKYVFGESQEIAPTWKYYVSEYPFSGWNFYKETAENLDIAGRKELPTFSGKILLSGKFKVKEEGKYLLDFGSSSLGISLKLNGVDLGEKIGAPYTFDLKDAVKVGENQIEIVLTTTLGLSKRDKFTHFSAIEKYGLTQNLKLIPYEIK